MHVPSAPPGVLRTKIPIVWMFLAVTFFGPYPGPRAVAQFNPPPVAVLTQRYGPDRAGANIREHVLTVAALSSREFQELYSIPVTGQVYARSLN